MSSEAKRAVNISNMPDLLALAEEVRRTNEPRLLKRDDEDLAILVPLEPAGRRRPKAARRDYEAFCSAAGGWKNLDTDELVAKIYEDRHAMERPPVEL